MGGVILNNLSHEAFFSQSCCFNTNEDRQLDFWLNSNGTFVLDYLALFKMYLQNAMTITFPYLNQFRGYEHVCNKMEQTKEIFLRCRGQVTVRCNIRKVNGLKELFSIYSHLPSVFGITIHISVLWQSLSVTMNLIKLF